MAIQPRQVEHFAAGALRAAAGEERVGQQCAEQVGLHHTRGSPRPIRIVGLAALALDPCIQQHIARATVEAVDRLVVFDQAEVAEAAHVENGQALAEVAEQVFMEGRHQWRTLATGRHIATAEVSDHADTGKLGQ